MGVSVDDGGGSLTTDLLIRPTLKRAVVSLTADGVVVPAVVGRKIKVYGFEIQSATDAMTIQLKSGDATGTALGILWVLNAREGVFGQAMQPPAYMFATNPGQALFADLAGVGTVAIAVSYWDEDMV